MANPLSLKKQFANGQGLVAPSDYGLYAPDLDDDFLEIETEFNSLLTDVTNILNPFKVMTERTTAQTGIVTATWTDITLTEVVDIGNWFTTGSAIHQVPNFADGDYLLHGWATFDESTAGASQNANFVRAIRFVLGSPGTLIPGTLVYIPARNGVGGTEDVSLVTTGWTTLAATNQIKLQVRHDAGANMSISTAGVRIRQLVGA